MRNRGMTLVILGGVFMLPVTALAQNKYTNVFGDLMIVEKESAEAKTVRLKWISEERNRVHAEMQKYESELKELQQVVPDPVKPRVMSQKAVKDRELEEKNFNAWASTNNPTLRAAVLTGEGLNALLRVLAPIAHYRKTRSQNAAPDRSFPCLNPDREIKPAEAMHFRLSPATSAGSQFIVRPNQVPLEIEWPSVVRQDWKDACVSIGKTRDSFVKQLTTNPNGTEYLDQADLLDQSLALLQAKILKAKDRLVENKSIEVKKRILTHREMQDAIRYLESLRATVDRFKKVPGDYKVRQFSGGTIEDFLDFCYTHGMVFQKAQPSDDEAYWKLHAHMKDYAKDVQFIEDWKSDLEKRIRELSSEDQKLVWNAAEQ